MKSEDNKFKVYVAGKLNDDVVGYLNNVHQMMVLAEEARKEGFSVFVPALDLLMGIKFGYEDYTDYFNNSQPWLDVSDGILLVSNFPYSKGTAREIKRAMEGEIPVFLFIEDMIEYRDTGRGKHIVGMTIEDGTVLEVMIGYGS